MSLKPQRFAAGLALLWTLAFFSRGFADGMAFGYDPNMARWSLQEETSQLCLINHRDGLQHMLVSVALSELRLLNSAWILPVPARPESTTVAIYRGFPRLRGADIVGHAQEELSTTIVLLGLTSVYPPSLVREVLTNWLLPGLGHGIGGSAGDAGYAGVSVHDHVEAYGLTAELVAADSPGTLLGYLRAQGAELPDVARPVLDSYAGGSFSFVIAWISDTLVFMRESIPRHGSRDHVHAIGLSLTFPTGQAYFPLRPTSVYGDTRVPMAVYVVGHVTPMFHPGLSKSASVEYRHQDGYRVPEDFASFFGGDETLGSLEYTVVEMSPPSRELTEDLWFSPRRPFRATYATFVIRFPGLWIPLLVLLVNCLASLLAGWIALGRHRLPWVLQALFGLLNCLTALVFVVSAALARFPERHPKQNPGTEPPRPASPRRKIAFVVVFIVVFNALLVLAWFVTHAPLR